MQSLKVECYSGYKANERPKSFVLNDNKLIVEKVIDQWRTSEHEYFKLLADNGKEYTLRYEVRSDEWGLE